MLNNVQDKAALFFTLRFMRKSSNSPRQVLMLDEVLDNVIAIICIRLGCTCIFKAKVSVCLWCQKLV